MNVLDPFIDPNPEVISVSLPEFKRHTRVFLRTTTF